MSGGSYSYLCHKAADDFIVIPHELVEMVERLEGMDGDDARVAAEASRAVLEGLRLVQYGITQALVGLDPVWKAVEWRDSSDWGDEQLNAALADFRAAHG